MAPKKVRVVKIRNYVNVCLNEEEFRKLEAKKKKEQKSFQYLIHKAMSEAGYFK